MQVLLGGKLSLTPMEDGVVMEEVHFLGKIAQKWIVLEPMQPVGLPSLLLQQVLPDGCSFR